MTRRNPRDTHEKRTNLSRWGRRLSEENEENEAEKDRKQNHELSEARKEWRKKRNKERREKERELKEKLKQLLETHQQVPQIPELTEKTSPVTTRPPKDRPVSFLRKLWAFLIDPLLQIADLIAYLFERE